MVKTIFNLTMKEKIFHSSNSFINIAHNDNDTPNDD